MGKCILVIKNDLLYPVASGYIKEMESIFTGMDYEIRELDENEDRYYEKLELFREQMKTVIECKAVVTCNAISMEKITTQMDCLYCSFLEGDLTDYHEKLSLGNQNTVIFCFSQSSMDYIKENYKNIGGIKYSDINCTESGKLPENMEEDFRNAAEMKMAVDILEMIAVRQGGESTLKFLIQRNLENLDLSQAKALIEEYKRKNPFDLDVVSMETILELYSGNLEASLRHALEGVRRYPCNADLYYNLGNVYESMEKWFWAWLAYERAYLIYVYMKDRKIEALKIEERVHYCKMQYEEHPDGTLHASCEDMAERSFGLFEPSFRAVDEHILGGYYWESALEKRYVGTYFDDILLAVWGMNEGLLHTKGEFVKVTEGNEFEVASGDTEVFLPIAVKNINTLHKIVHEGEESTIRQLYNRHFNYYRLPPNTRIYSSGTAYYGRPVSLKQEENKKKLVLNIFVDGLAQCIIDGDSFDRNMPYTAQFFKKGTVCTRAYNTSEWTYPSIANYVTGLDTTHHMLFHSTLDSSMPQEYPTLAEYFQEKGYFTAKMCGNWRIIPTYGHARGYDQFIYQHQILGFRADMIVGQVIDHIEAFKETNQFLWMSIGDLHDIADSYDMPNSVQRSVDIKNYSDEETGPTSVKQEYSENKRVLYEKMARRVDTLLNVIYHYIESNYKNEEILVTLFSDHGQGFLIPPGEYFCAEERSRVAFMFRGDQVLEQVCDEVISTSDYIKIMCKLADIEMKDLKIDGVLPKAFGGDGREYALTESIHPGDPYQAAIYADDCVFYFFNSYPVQDDGRFYLKQCNAMLTDLEGNELEDEEKIEKYLSILLEHIAPLRIYD